MKSSDFPTPPFTSVALVAFFLAVAGKMGVCSLTILEGSGVELVQLRKVEGFARVLAEKGVEVRIELSDAEQVTVSGDDNLVDRITTEVVGDVLQVSLVSDEGMIINNTLPLFVMVRTPGLLEVRADAGSSVSVFDLVGEKLDLLINGGSNLLAEGLAITDLIVAAEGGSSVEASGSATQATVMAGGGSSVDLANLETVDMEVEVSGGSNATVNVSGSLVITASGGSTVEHSGDPDSVELKDISGGSSVTGN
jgi:hypothetical protein